MSFEHQREFLAQGRLDQTLGPSSTEIDFERYWSATPIDLWAGSYRLD
ncbi:MAG: hypothetical protein IJT59_07165 [Desulfovibrionaceae bacterium]|nr:hypothetical protein [Desulfovibrionaceae bacterium]